MHIIMYHFLAMSSSYKYLIWTETVARSMIDNIIIKVNMQQMNVYIKVIK